MSDGPHRNRGRRLILCGALTVVAGVFLGLLGVAGLLLPVVHRLFPRFVEQQLSWPLILSQLLTHLVLAAVVIWAGVGSMRRRRWAPTVLRTLAWTAVWTGIALLGLTAWSFDSLFVTAGSLDPLLVTVIKGIVLAVLALVGVIAPGVLVWLLGDRDVQRTCDAASSGRDPLDRVPPARLALSLLLALAGVMLVPLALEPAFPWFGALVEGAAGVLLTLGLAASLVGLAWLTLKGRMLAWWAGVVLIVVGGVSLAWTAYRGGLDRWLELMGYPDELRVAWSGAGPMLIAITVGMTVVSLVYMVSIRKQFP